ncbi:hypothetical protein CDD81_7180 [Ophiocordyceps australis]|uniref:C3H1-type domain-containing protein n=1 Tax=Ophiocordyceps australis TaxID=1399860 RepID=A0A2C5Y5Z0_9HYPO|nr:hypothetical protein CDD81_7180 [Ophiocordyceps australis]
MSSYGYAPPPPPPPTGGVYAQPTVAFGHHGPPRSGATSGSRGRGGQYPRGRADYRAATGPPTHGYDYAQQYAPPHGAPYQSHPSTVAYQPHHSQSWAGDHASMSHHPNAHSSHAPAPISPSNYHPNYAPPSFASQYPQQTSYDTHFTNPYNSPPPHWPSQGPPQHGHFVASRGRGGYGDRGGSKLPTHTYDREQAAMVGAFGQPYSPLPGSRTTHYPHAQYSFVGPSMSAPGSRHEGRHSYFQRRGRGGPRDSFRGRGSHNHGGDRSRNQPTHSKQESKIKAESPSVGKKKKRRTNTLGLTPGMESETEDDEGEEKALLELIGSEALRVTDMTTFLAERRKNYPTKARVEAKKAAELAQLDKEKAELLEKQADRLRKQLRKVESSIKRKRDQGDEGDEMRESSQDQSDEDMPEVLSSRSEAAASLSQPKAKRADVTRHCKYFSTGGTCGKKGKCRFVHDVQERERAIKERQANDGRMTIQQRLILNDKEQEDLTILQSIQYLREKGVMGPSANPSVSNDDKGDPMDGVVKEEKQTPRKAASGLSLLPAAPASLPEPPIRKEAGLSRRIPSQSVLPRANSVGRQGSEHCQSWLLKPYGSSNGTQSLSDDLP